MYAAVNIIPQCTPAVQILRQGKYLSSKSLYPYYRSQYDKAHPLFQPQV